MLYQLRRGRIRPSRIVVFETNRAIFSKLAEAKRRLSMSFNGQEIESLAMIELAVRNEGANTIEDIQFEIEVDESVRILAIQPQAAPYGVAIKDGELDSSSRAITISYLNPFSLGKHEVRLAMFCEAAPPAIELRGGGKGWSLDFLGQEELEALEKRRRRAMLPIGMVILVLYFGSVIALGFLVNLLLNRFFAGWTGESWQGALFLVCWGGLIGLLSWAWSKALGIIDLLLKPYPD